jgi:hypothetical protein
VSTYIQVSTNIMTSRRPLRARKTTVDENVNPQVGKAAKSGTKREGGSFISLSERKSKLPKVDIYGNGSDEEQSMAPCTVVVDTSNQEVNRKEDVLQKAQKIAVESMRVEPPTPLSSPIVGPLDYLIRTSQVNSLITEFMSEIGVDENQASRLRQRVLESLVPNPGVDGSVAKPTSVTNTSASYGAHRSPSVMQTPKSSVDSVSIASGRSASSNPSNYSYRIYQAFSEDERSFLKKEYLRSAFIDGLGPGLQDDASNYGIAEILIEHCVEASRGSEQCMVIRRSEIEDGVFPNQSALKQLISDIRYKLVHDVEASLTRSRDAVVAAKQFKEFIKAAMVCEDEGAISEVPCYRFYDVHGLVWEKAIHKSFSGTELVEHMNTAVNAKLESLDDPKSSERISFMAWVRAEAFIRTIMVKYRRKGLKVSSSFQDWLKDYHHTVIGIQHEIAEWICFRRQSEQVNRSRESDVLSISFTKLREKFERSQKDTLKRTKLRKFQKEEEDRIKDDSNVDDEEDNELDEVE